MGGSWACWEPAIHTDHQGVAGQARDGVMCKELRKQGQVVSNFATGTRGDFTEDSLAECADLSLRTFSGK